MIALEPMFVAALLIVFIASLFRATFGFGDALIAMPLLTMTVGIDLARPYVALVSVTIAGLVLVRDWRQVHFSSAWRLVASSLVGIPLGMYLAARVPEFAVKTALAVVVIGFAVFNLARPHLIRLTTDRGSYVFGFLAGILGGAYNAPGPALVVYGSLRRWPAAQFRATLQGFFFPTSLVIVAAHGLNGNLTPTVWWLYLFALPLVLLALPAGGWLNRHVVRKEFARLVYVLLIAIGVSLLVSAIASS